jgi:hypothetical protein
VQFDAGDPIRIESKTPAGGPAEFANSLDPIVELYDPTGAFVASDDNGAPDGRNALVRHAAMLSGAYTLRVTGVNGTRGEYTLRVALDQPPDANDDTYTITESGKLIASDGDGSATASVNDNGVLVNDSDPDGDSLTVNTTPVSGPAHGTLLLSSDGTFVYTPQPGFHGVDSFVYEVSDGSLTRTASVTINVLSAQEQIATLLALVQQLVHDGALNAGQGNALSVKLGQILSKLERGKINVALNVLNAFTNQVDALISGGVLTPEEGQPVLNAADDLKTTLTAMANARAATDLAVADEGLLGGIRPSFVPAAKPGKK